jgi:hypothetical protein
MNPLRQAFGQASLAPWLLAGSSLALALSVLLFLSFYRLSSPDVSTSTRRSIGSPQARQALLLLLASASLLVLAAAWLLAFRQQLSWGDGI